MNRILVLILSFIFITMSLSACGNKPSSDIEIQSPSSTPTENVAMQAEIILENDTLDEPEPSDDKSEESNMTNISITIGSTVFSVKLYNNDTANALVKLFPMTVDMSELNSNEKYYYLPNNLLTDSQRVGSINAGDLMLYGSDCLVLFYESFNTSYSYTKLGYIEDISGLVAALGSSGVEVSFAVSD